MTDTAPVTGAEAQRPRRRPWIFGSLVLICLGALAGGIVIAVRGYGQTAGPGGVVRGYFAALQRGDAATALAFGSTPPGSRVLLTDRALREQQRVAALRDVHVGAVHRSGSRATVAVRYRLAFAVAQPAVAQPTVTVQVPVHESDGDWRLDATAISTTLSLRVADQRASVLGGRVPSGEVLLFPGAPPIRFDTSYLALVPGDASVTFGSDPTSHLGVQITRAGRAAMIAATVRAVRDCLASAHPSVVCPLPGGGRYVPGSVRGTVSGTASQTSVSLSPTRIGTLVIYASIPVHAARYQRLDFYNRVSTGSGSLTLAVHALAPATSKLAISWLTA